MRVLVVLIASCALAAASLTGCGSDDEPTVDVPTPAEARRELGGSPPQLAAIHAQASELLPGGKAALARRIEELKGYPVVVNVWAAWCGPCKREFPFLQRAAVRYGGSVAFLGVDTQDVAKDARAWLRSRWIAYPSYEDRDGEVADEHGLLGVPSTIFFDRDGEVAYMKQGEYKDEAALEKDLQRYVGATPGS